MMMLFFWVLAFAESRTPVDLNGASIEGELRNPSEMYFQHRPDEAMHTLIQPRKQFHQRMLRDAVRR